MNQDDIKLVIDQLDRVELQYHKDTDTVKTAINMLETLGNKVAELNAWNDKIGCTNYVLRQQVAEQQQKSERINHDNQQRAHEVCCTCFL